jgi:hypothetical protein
MLEGRRRWCCEMMLCGAARFVPYYWSLTAASLYKAYRDGICACRVPVVCSQSKHGIGGLGRQFSI